MMVTASFGNRRMISPTTVDLPQPEPPAIPMVSILYRIFRLQAASYKLQAFNPRLEA
jgi:hypothetical protein